jgi:hypothetical protein
MKNFLCTLATGLALFLSFQSSGQIAFNTEYGGIDDEEGRWMEQTADSGFIMTGSTLTYSNGSSDIWLVKADANGNQQWQKSKGGTGFDFANMVKVTSDGGYIIAGFTSSYGAGNNDGWLVKTDANGNTQWTQTFGNSGVQEFEAVVQTADGGYACVGINYSNGTGYYDIYLVKTNSSGVMQWSKNLGGGSYEIGNSIQIAPDGGYIIAGQSYSYDATSAFYLLKTDASGNEQWHKTFASGHLCEAHYVQNVPGGGYILCGDADTTYDFLGESDMWIIRTDANGDSLWAHAYGGTKKDGGKTIEPTSDGGYFAAGITRSYGLADPNYYAVKIDSSGVVEWVQNFGTGYHDHAYRGIETSDGGYALFGFYRNLPGHENFGLVKLGPGGGFLRDISIDRIVTPTNIICTSSGSPIKLLLRNNGTTYEDNIVCYLSVSGPGGNFLYQDTMTSTLNPDTIENFNFSPQLFNSLTPGTYELKAYTIHRNGDISYSNDTLTSSIEVILPSPDPVTTSGHACVGPASITLTATGADSLFWYNSSGTMLGSGHTFQTPPAYTATYYAQNQIGKGDKVGASDSTIGGGLYFTGTAYGLAFDARKNFKLISVLVYANVAGPRTIQLKDANNNLLQTGTYNLVPGPQRVFLNFDVPQGNDLKLLLATGSSPLFKNNVGANYPYNISQTVEIYGPSAFNNSNYFYFYDWYIFVPYENCGSNLIPATAVTGTVVQTDAFDETHCGPGSVTLTVNANGGTQWWSDSTGGSLLQTGNTYTTPSLNTTTTYYIQTDTCSHRMEVQAIIAQISVDPTAADSSRCGPGVVTLAASSPDTVYWYDAPVGGNLVGTGSPFNTPYLNSSATYYVQAGFTCPSNRIQVHAIVNSATAPVGTDVSACGPDSVTLSASSINNILWFDAAIGGNQVGAGPTFTTPVLSANATYYAEAQSTCVSARTPVNAFITTINEPIAVNGSHCGPGVIVLSGTSTNTVNWYDVPTGGSVISSGINFTTSLLDSTTIYYVEATDGNCISTRIPVTATIIYNDAPVVTSSFNCGAGTVTLNATASDTIYWFDDMVNGNLLGSGSPFVTPFLNMTDTFYAQTSLGCPGPRAAAEAVIGTTSADPVTTGMDICANNTGTVTATAADSISWYDDQGTFVGSGSVFTSPVLTDTTTYFAVAGTMCPSQQVPATINVMPGSVDPVTTNDSVCTSGILTLTANATDPITWYDDQGTIVGTGSTFTTPLLTSTATYYAVAMDHCPSNQVAALAIVNQVSADPVTTGGSVCDSGVVTLTATSADSITWYDFQGTVVGTGSSFTTPVLTANTTYYAVAGVACPSQQVPAYVTVHVSPTVTLGPDSIQTGAISYVLDAGAGYTSYLWSNSASTQTITVNQTGTYCVTVTDSFGCSNSDCSYIDFMVGIHDINQQSMITMMPNPTTGNISIYFSTTAGFKEMEMMDETGRLIFSRKISGDSYINLDLSTVAKGVYFFRFEGEHTVKTERIILE